MYKLPVKEVYELAHAQYIIISIYLCMYTVQLYIGEGMIQEFRVDNSSVFTSEAVRHERDISNAGR